MSVFDNPVSKIVTSETLMFCRPEDPVRDVARLMANMNVGSILIQDEDEVVGIATERDVCIKALARDLSFDTPVEEIMVNNPKSVDENEPIKHAMIRMRDGGFRHILVKKDGKVNALLSVKDINALICDEFQLQLDSTES